MRDDIRSIVKSVLLNTPETKPISVEGHSISIYSFEFQRRVGNFRRFLSDYILRIRGWCHPSPSATSFKANEILSGEDLALSVIKGHCPHSVILVVKL